MGNTVPTFSTGGGKITTDLGGNFAGMGVALQTDGKILVTGYGTNSTVGLVRYNTDGSLDTSFDGDGKVTTDFGTDSSADSVTVQADGKILVSGNADGGNVALVRYNTNGSLDTNFDGDGRVSTDLGATCYGATCALQADGKILVAAVAEGSFVLVRYNTNGSLDTSFDGDGKVSTDFGGSDSGFSVTTQADGKILVAGYSVINGGNQVFALARYNTDGSLDASPPADTTAPTVSSFSPTDGATGIATTSNITLSFSEAIQRGTGSITLENAAGATIETFNAASSSQLSISGSTLTIDPTSTLANSTNYYVTFASGTIKDLAGNAYAGTTSYDFTTIADTTALLGTAGNDSIQGGALNEIMDGGGGIDTAIFSGNHTDCTITKTVTGFTLSGDGNGTDTLINIERLQFADCHVALDLEGNAGSTAKILGAVFNSASVGNKTYAGIGLGLLDGGMSYEDLAALAINAAGASTPQQVVNLLWANVVGGTPSTGQAQPFVDMLNSGMTIGQLGVLAADTAINQANINLVGLAQTGLEFA